MCLRESYKWSTTKLSIGILVSIDIEQVPLRFDDS